MVTPDVTADIQPAPTQIPAQSEREAMDWSLVLTSQEIGSTLRHDDEGDRWYLEVEPQDYARALGILRQYRWENRGWGWRQPLPWTGILFHFGALGWCGLLILVYGLDAWHGEAYRQFGMADGPAVLRGQWWRLFTAMTLHADVGHLASNVTIGFLLYGLAMARYGAGWALLAGGLAGVLGNGVSVLLLPGSHLGASGMVMGALGMVSVQSLSFWRHGRRAFRWIASGLLTGSLLFILMGLDPNADVVAHLGGFIGGLVLGAGLSLLPERILLGSIANMAAGLFIGLAALLSWWLALSRRF
jgi:rhomboid protease GluP